MWILHDYRKSSVKNDTKIANDGKRPQVRGHKLNISDVDLLKLVPGSKPYLVRVQAQSVGTHPVSDIN